MANIAPRLDLSVPDTLKGDGNLKVELNFTEFAHFHPEAIVAQVPRLAKLLEARQQLRDLLSKLDGNDELDALLENIVQNTNELKQLREQAPAAAAAAAVIAAAAAPEIDVPGTDPDASPT
jgi:type VI secretion system protein ImpB